MLPKISIIIPAFNREKIIEETLASVLDQSYSNWECIVVDDGSTDDTEEIVKSYTKQDERFIFLKRSRAPKGAPCCRNIGIAHAKGDYLIFLDSDDLLAPWCLEERYNCITKLGCDFYISSGSIFNYKPGDTKFLWNYLQKNSTDIDRFLKSDMPFSTIGPIWKKKSIERLSGWDENLLDWQDGDLHIRALLSGLSYQKSDTDFPDYFIRQTPETGHNQISVKQFSPAYLQSKKLLFVKIKDLILEQDTPKENKNRQIDYLSSYFFRYANWMKVRKNGAYKEFLASMYKEGLTRYVRYLISLFYIWGSNKYGKTPILRSFFYRFIAKLLPAHYVSPKSTFKTATLSEEMYLNLKRKLNYDK